MRWLLLLAFVALPVVGNAQPADIRAAQARHSALLSCGGATDAEALWACAGEFTARVAYDVRGSEWTIFRKLGGRRCAHGGTTIDCDKLLNTTTREFFDVVGGAGAPGMRVAWISEGFDTPGNLVPVVAQPYATAPAPTPPPTPAPAPAPPVDLSPVLAKLDAILAKLDTLEQNHAGIAAVALEARNQAAVAAVEAFNAATRALSILDALAVRPCFAGNQSGWAGGKIRLCPE